MRIGFGKHDITPRLGVELTGYSGYLNRYATAVRDQLWARSMAVSDGHHTAVIVSCDVVFIPQHLAAEVRRLVSAATGLAPHQIMVHATHTHSGPAMRVDYRNAYDPPYTHLLPRRIAASCISAVKSMQQAQVQHACVPCEGMGANRVYDKFNYGLDGLKDGFRPEKSELTDTTCHVLKVIAGRRTLGFVSYFGCHNVVGGRGSTYIHGDYAGIATGILEREHPGAVGLFLQGAVGDVNAAGSCFGNDMVLHALDVMAGRYANAVRDGLARAKPIDDGAVRMTQRQIRFSRRQIDLNTLRQMLAAEHAVTQRDDADDNDPKFRMAVLRSDALTSIIHRAERGESFENKTELQAIRFGPVALLAAPVEIFQAIKNDVVAKAQAPIALVMSLTNDEQGYAVDRTTSDNEADYAARTVPLWKYTLPYANIHDELQNALLEMDDELTDENDVCASGETRTTSR